MLECVSTQCLENKWIEFHQSLHMCFYGQYLGWDIFVYFLLIFNRVIALDRYQNFVPAQYL